MLINFPTQNHSYLVVDFSKFEDYKIKIEKYVKNNQVDILINNTQGPPAGNSLSKNIDSYQEAFDLLFKSVVHTTSLVIPGCRKINGEELLMLPQYLLKNLLIILFCQIV